MSRRPVALAGLVLLAMALRAAAIVHTHAWDAAPEENRLIARNLRAGRGFTFTQFGVTGPTAVRGPAYPMLLAILGPDRVKLILAVNVFAGAVSVVAAYALLARFVPGRGSFLAAAALAVWPTQIYAATLTQGLSLSVAMLLASLSTARPDRPLANVVAGLLGGFAALTEPVLAVPLLLASGPLSRYSVGGLGRGSAELRVRQAPSLILPRAYTGEGTRAATYLVAFLVLVAPWLYRNAIVFGRPMPLTSNFWPDAFLGNSTTVATGPTPRQTAAIDRLPPPDYDRLKRPEPQRVAVFREWTLHWVGGHPARYAGRCLGRALATYFTAGGHPLSGNPVYVASRVIAGLWFVTWLVPAGPRFNGLAGLLVCLVAGICLTAAFSLAEARNGVMMDVPQLIGLAAGLGRRVPAKAAA